MPSRFGGNNGRSTLGQGLDREIYQIVRKFNDEQSQYDDGRSQRLAVSELYEKIKRSNSSLNRKSKRLLEDSIDRVLQVLKEENASNDEVGSIGGDYEGIETAEDASAQTTNVMNRSIVGMWAKDSPVPSADTVPASNEDRDPSSAPPISKKRHTNGEPTAKRRKPTAAGLDRSPPTHISLADLGGVDQVIQELEDLIVLPLLKPEIYTASRIQPPRGILLHGPPGCGKTMIANAFAAEIGVPFIAISAPSIVSGMSGESEKALREHFEEAKKMAPCLIFIDEIDAITPKRESAQREMEKRIVAQLLTCMDDLALEKTGGKAVIVMAATNRPDALDPALRRGGRFDKEINMSVPNEAVREQILRTLTRNMSLSGDFDFKQFAKLTPGFVGADLNDLVSTAGAAAIKRFLTTLKSQTSSSDSMELDTDPNTPISAKVIELRRLIKRAKEPPSSSHDLASSDSQPQPADQTTVSLTPLDFATALPKIQPSSKREGFATIPDTTFADIGALRPVREELLTAIVDPIRSPEKYARVGITAPTGVLLWGPPGCGKTLLAKAVANESRANFISVKGPELLNKYVGESERAVRQVFVRARSSVPCVIFFDELDALVPRRRDDAMSESSARVVNTLLTELDGLSSRAGIYVIAATNRPDIIDTAMLRPGRLETLLFVDLPGEEERVEILKTLVKGRGGGDGGGGIVWDSEEREESQSSSECACGMEERPPRRGNGIGGIEQVARSAEGFSGADLEALLRRAGYAAIKRNDVIRVQDFWTARESVRPSVVDRAKYEKLRRRWGGGTAV